MRRKQNQQKDILFILISSFILVIFWIGFNLHHIWATSTISQTIQLQLNPIDPTFDKNTINQLQSREQVTPVWGLPPTASQSADQTDTSSPSPSIDVTPTEATATDASQITPTGGITIQGQ